MGPLYINRAWLVLLSIILKIEERHNFSHGSVKSLLDPHVVYDIYCSGVTMAMIR